MDSSFSMDKARIHCQTREKALELSDLTLLIPLDSRVESLNVATAASVCLFEQRRRRLSGIAHK